MPLTILDIIQNEFNNNIGQYGVISQAEIDYAHQAAADPSLPPYKFIQEGGQQKLVAGGHVQDFYHEWFKTYSLSKVIIYQYRRW